MLYNNYSDQSVQDLRRMFPNLNFLETKFDNSVMGINTENNRVIYHEWDMIHTLMKEIDIEIYDMDSDTDQWCDFYDECSEMVYSLEHFESVDTHESLPPKVCRDSEQLCNHLFNRPESL
jgi:hypothetical protein